MSWRWGAWNLSAAGEVHTGWPRSTIAAGINSSRYPMFHTLDARVSRDFDLKQGSLNLFFEVINLYNRGNPCCTEYVLQTTADGGSVLVDSQSNWLPLVPSLGVVWRF